LAAILVSLVFAAQRLVRVTPEWRLPNLPNPSSVIITATLAAMLLPVGLRLALLPWHPVPQPVFADEFVHQLEADTLAGGHLANPAHPLWRHLDTLYVLQQPTYSGIYPIGQGAILAAGQVLAGNPWFGIVFATALMCGAVAWVLFELLPWKWAAIGVLPVAFTYGLGWMDSINGGSGAAHFALLAEPSYLVRFYGFADHPRRAWPSWQRWVGQLHG